MQGTGVAVLPLDLPGISRGKPLDKMGMRALNQGEIIFEDKNVKLKLFRDARAGTIADGDNEALALVGAGYL